MGELRVLGGSLVYINSQSTRAALPRCCTCACLRFDGWGVWAEFEICLAVLQEDPHLPPVSGAAGARALTRVGRMLGILGRARNLLGSRARRPTRATSKRAYRADKTAAGPVIKHAGAAGSCTGGSLRRRCSTLNDTSGWSSVPFERCGAGRFDRSAVVW
jgi:hypothetical protein